MTEQLLKKRIFIFLLISKLLIILLIWFHYRTGGYSLSEALATIGLILPMFTVYITAIIKDALKDPYKKAEAAENQRVVSSIVRTMTYAIFPLYTLLFMWVIGLKPQSGSFTFENLQTALSAIESGFGVYVGLIVFSLFKD